MRIHYFSGFITFIKYLLRSKSLDFALNCMKQPSEILKLTYNHHEIHYRSCTSDVQVLNWILLKKGENAEYQFKIDRDPRVILDIGGNIGISAIKFSLTYPNATIFTIEPVPDNFELLKKNVSPYPNVRAFCFGLGADAGTFPIYADTQSSNKGGYTVISNTEVPHEKSAYTQVHIKKVSDFLAENSITAVDLIKIDTEGAEYDILTAFPTEILSRVGWLIGELHDTKDFELLAYLSKWFSIGIHKAPDCYYSIFRAVNRSNAHPDAVPGTRTRAVLHG